jgi:hypothetical protein
LAVARGLGRRSQLAAPHSVRLPQARCLGLQQVRAEAHRHLRLEPALDLQLEVEL